MFAGKVLLIRPVSPASHLEHYSRHLHDAYIHANYRYLRSLFNTDV